MNRLQPGSTLDFKKFNGMRAFRSHFILGVQAEANAFVRYDRDDGLARTFIYLNQRTKVEVKTKYGADGKPMDYVVPILIPQRSIVRDNSKYVPRTTYGAVSLAFLKKHGVLPNKKVRAMQGQIINEAVKKAA